MSVLQTMERIKCSYSISFIIWVLSIVCFHSHSTLFMVRFPSKLFVLLNIQLIILNFIPENHAETEWRIKFQDDASGLRNQTSDLWEEYKVRFPFISLFINQASNSIFTYH